MFRKLAFLSLVILVLGVTAACSPSAATMPETPGAPLSAAPPSQATQEVAPEPDTPAAVTEAFYGWYLKTIGDRSSGEFHNPLVEGLYKESPHLTEGFIGQIDEALAGMGGQSGFDPILLAQDIPISIKVQESSVNGSEATAIVSRTWAGNPEPSPLMVHLVQQDGLWRIDNVTAFETAPLTKPAELGPAETVEAFYRWYVDYSGDDMMRTEKNPLVDGAYRDNEYLSQRFVQQVDEYVTAYNPYGYDPIVMSIYVPDQFTVGEATIEGETATVTMMRTWSGFLDSWLPMKVFLQQENGRWLINDVTAIVSDTTLDGDGKPEEVVEAFYTWLLAYTGSPAAGEFRNPIVDRAYANSPYLTADLIAAIDTHLAQMRAREIGGSDPFLCAQNIPLSIVIDNAYLQPATDDGREQAQVIMYSGFAGTHYLVLTLQPVEDTWRIDQIDCASMTPAGVSKAFYTWYLGYIGAQAGSVVRNPLADGAYRNTAFLTEDFVRRVDELVAGFEQGGYDPFLQAQDIPQGFSVTPGPGENEALVDFTFVGPDNVPYGAWRVLATLVEDSGHWTIDDVQGNSLPELATFESDSYGFTFLYPAGWVVNAMDFTGPGMPDDWPVVAGWQVMPSDVAEQLAAQTAPDPNAPPIIAPFQVEIVAGDETAVARAYRPLDEAEVTSIGRKLAYAFHLEPGYSHLIFPHPYRPDEWIVVTDWVTEFPGREIQAEAALPVRQQLLNSLVLEK
ncbi:MAG: DUF3828 domain-containing protein [Candidatus Promineifilaceae bacterium]